MFRKSIPILTALLMFVGLATAAAPDPRPHILVLGDFNSMPLRGKPAWCALLPSRHPEWRVSVDAEWNRMIGPSAVKPKMKKGKKIGERVDPGVLDTFDAIMGRTRKATMVVVFMGGNDAKTEMAKRTTAKQCGERIGELIGRLKSHEKTKSARIVVVTPMPVVEARLDKWSKKTFEGAEANSKAIAEAVNAAAREKGADVIDAWAYGYESKGKDGKPGGLLGGTGWVMGSGAQKNFAEWITPQLEKLDPQPVDKAGYAQWQKVREARAILESILAETSDGVVAHGNALEGVAPQAPGQKSGKRKKKGSKGEIVKIPLTLLKGPSLDVLVMPLDQAVASVGAANGAFGAVPILKIQTTDGELTIKPKETDSRLIDEALPTEVIPGDRFGVNAGKWRPYPVMCKVEGKRRWLLLRIDLAKLNGKEVKTAQLSVPYSMSASYTQELRDGAPRGFKAEGAYGKISVHPISGPDVKWSPLGATWKTRDGKHGWTGGTVDKTARKEKLKVFLDGNPPAPVAAAAKGMLDTLK